MKFCLRRFASDTSGATAIEYALIGTLIAVAIIGGVGLVGTAVKARFTDVAAAVVATPGQ